MKTLNGGDLFALLTLMPPIVAFCNDSWRLMPLAPIAHAGFRRTRQERLALWRQTRLLAMAGRRDDDDGEAGLCQLDEEGAAAGAFL